MIIDAPVLLDLPTGGVSMTTFNITTIVALLCLHGLATSLAIVTWTWTNVLAAHARTGRLAAIPIVPAISM
jgi:hypothetical protein